MKTSVAAGVEALGGLDVLVNNAGISGPTVSVEEMNPDDSGFGAKCGAPHFAPLLPNTRHLPAPSSS